MTVTALSFDPAKKHVAPRDGSGEMFDRIAERYDLINRIVSLGMDRSWRRRTVAELDVDSTSEVLDVATGTADLALKVAKIAHARVTGVDPSSGMLEIGRRKVRASGLQERVKLLLGTAEELPFADRTFDAACMAFGIRNVADRPRGLGELCRVVKPGGRVCILELSEPRGGLLAPLAQLHVHTVVPWLGSVLSGAHEYRYLQRSIAAFPTPAKFASMLEEAGFHAHTPLPLTFGVAHLYVGTRAA